MKEYTLLNGRVLKVTEKAVLIHTGNKDQSVFCPCWIPKSLIENGQDVKEDDTEIFVEDWFCEKEIF
jgi:hypothetical protein